MGANIWIVMLASSTRIGPLLRHKYQWAEGKRRYKKNGEQIKWDAVISKMQKCRCLSKMQFGVTVKFLKLMVSKF